MNIIETLNKHATKTPDEIVAQIKKWGWINITRMTPQQAEALDGKAVVVGADNGPVNEPFWVVAGLDGSWIFNAVGWYPYDGHSNYFWFILFEEYGDGVFPPEYAESSRDQDA